MGDELETLSLSIEDELINNPHTAGRESFAGDITEDTVIQHELARGWVKRKDLMGDMDLARVEFNRALDRQRRAKENYNA